MTRPRMITAWLDGCSGCHMSLLDLDERIIELAARADILMSPLVDAKTLPEQIDIAIIEGAVGSEADLERIRAIRERTRILIALGDCAVTSNVPAMRNPFGVDEVLRRAYVENADRNARPPADVLPLLPRSRPIHEFVRVDRFLPGCPPSADTIWEAIDAALKDNAKGGSEESRDKTHHH